MSFCTNCGKEIADGAVFCMNCGAKVLDNVPKTEVESVVEEREEVHTSQETQKQTEQPQYQAQYHQAPVQAVGMTPAVAALKKLGSSPLFLIAVIAFSISVILGLVPRVNSALVMLLNNEIIRELIWELDIDMSAFYNIVYGGGYLTNLIGAIPSILILSGLWMIYATCANKRSPYIKTSGFTMVKVVSVISLVFTCIGAALMLIILIIGGIGLVASGIEETGILVFILFFVFAAVYAFVIVYQAKVIASLNAAKSVAISGRANSRASSFVGVMCFIGAGFSSISFFISMVQRISVYYYGLRYVFVDALISIIGIFTTVCFALLIFKYRKEMKMLEYQN